MNILIVEDEVSLAEAIKKILEGKGWFADAVYDGEDAVAYATGANYDVIILDVMLPKMDGFQVVQTIRKKGVNSPVLMLTARTYISDKVTGLTAGADDYMTKPFDTDELVARIIALSRRKGEITLEELKHGDLCLELDSAKLSCNGESVQLSKKEFELCKMFLSSPSNTFTKDNIINTVWGYDSDATDNNVEAYISFLRKKFKYLGTKYTIKNIQKIGYKLEADWCKIIVKGLYG